VGDSLDLSRKARDADAGVIVFCGVYFMAESAKILSPRKTVLLPDMSAGCPMADMVSKEDVLRLRAEHPGAAVVAYVNSSAAVKAVSDICCTSTNAVRVVQTLPQKEIIFVPDKNLGHYVSRFLPEKNFIFHSGYCPVHDRIAADSVSKMRAAHPGAPVLVHPECPPEVVDRADFVGSTAQIIRYAEQSAAREFIIGTEQGVLYRMQRQNPDKLFHLLSDRLICPNMKKCRLEDVLHSLKTMEYSVALDDETIEKASSSLMRMLDA
jgi:quinolinate synthase